MANGQSMREAALAGLICGIGATVCGGACAPAGDDARDGTEAVASAIQIGTAPSIFRWAGRMTGSNGAQFNHSLDPAACDVESLAMALVSTDAVTQRYRVFGINRQTLSPSWTEYGTRTFGTRPACVRYQASYPDANFVVAGRGLATSTGAQDRRIFTSLAQWNLQPFSGPTPATPWTAVSGDTYQTNGSPALATSGFGALLTFLGDDARLYAHYQDYPYSGSNWGARVQAPALPSGWQAQGAPAVAFTHGAAGKFQIIVRARMNNMNRLYTLYFYIDRFTNWAGSPATTSSWTQVNTGSNVVDSDPAFAFDPFLPSATLYFRSGNDIIQTSGVGPQLGTLPRAPVVEFHPDTPTMVGAPAAQGGSGVDHGRNLVVTRASDNQLYACESEAGVVP
jgi:hypothetical protein